MDKLDEQMTQQILDGDATLLDVRTKEEYEKEKSPQAVNIDLADLVDDFQKLDKEKPIFAYCGSGGRAGRAQSFLLDKGYDVTNVGGYKDLPEDLK